ncbi:hypothetical protein RJ641_035089 [Dillenia turbinata]|uniref:Uncharacterized protein n=1 Tax=Dillenia turbinata TaxID=194707 RepID=A0AAN8ZC08_9MAGN
MRIYCVLRSIIRLERSSTRSLLHELKSVGNSLPLAKMGRLVPCSQYVGRIFKDKILDREQSLLRTVVPAN